MSFAHTLFIFTALRNKQATGKVMKAPERWCLAVWFIRDESFAIVCAWSCRPETFIASELEKYGPQVIFSRDSDKAGEEHHAVVTQYEDAEGGGEEYQDEEDDDNFEDDDLMWFDGHEGVTGNFTKTFKAEVSGHRPNSAATQQAVLIARQSKNALKRFQPAANRNAKVKNPRPNTLDHRRRGTRPSKPYTLNPKP
jgi:hypothetical protein